MKERERKKNESIIISSNEEKKIYFLKGRNIKKNPKNSGLNFKN